MQNQLNDMVIKDNAVKLVAKTAIFNESGQILVLTRSDTDVRRPGGLDFPGGNIDPGEDVLAGASREILEETGISIAPSDLQIIYTHADDSDDLVVLRFLCATEVKSPDIKLSFEHSAYEWMSIEDVVNRFETISWVIGIRFGLKNKIFYGQ